MTNLFALAILVLAVGGHADFVVEQLEQASVGAAADEGVELLQTRGLLNDEVQDVIAEEEEEAEAEVEADGETDDTEEAEEETEAEAKMEADGKTDDTEEAEEETEVKDEHRKRMDEMQKQVDQLRKSIQEGGSRGDIEASGKPTKALNTLVKTIMDQMNKEIFPGKLQATCKISGAASSVQATCSNGKISGTTCTCNGGFFGGGAYVSGATYPACNKATCSNGKISGTTCTCNGGFLGGGAYVSGATYPACKKKAVISGKSKLFVGPGSSATYKNTWSGWYQSGTTVGGGNGKRMAYDTMGLNAIRFEIPGKSAYLEYKLSASYKGKTLLNIVKMIMGSGRSNTNTGHWVGGTTIGALVGTSNAAAFTGFSQSLRIGVGDGSADKLDWALFMFLTGKGKGDFSGAKINAFGSETTMNPGYSGQVEIVGIGATNGMVSYGGYEYITMDQCPPATKYGKCKNTCQSQYLSLPAGYQLAPYSAAVVNNVVKKNYFGTHVVVFSNGKGYGTKAYTNGAYVTSNMLALSGGKYKANSCSYKILMRKALR